MADPIEDVIGDYRGFAAQRRDRLLALGIDIGPYELSHIAFRVPEWGQYVHVRTMLDRHASANRENFWNGPGAGDGDGPEPTAAMTGQAGYPNCASTASRCRSRRCRSSQSGPTRSQRR